MLINLWTGDWKTQFNMMNMKVDEDDEKTALIGNGRYQKFRLFSRNEFWKNIGCLVSDPTFGLGGYRLWEK